MRTYVFGRNAASLASWMLASAVCLANCVSARADVVTDWDAKASAVALPGALGEREVAIVDVAMFDAVNSIARRNRAYRVSDDHPAGASQAAAAIGAAARALEILHPQNAAEIAMQRDAYVKAMPAPAGLDAGLQLGERVAVRVCALRATDTATAPDRYRPRTRPGRYVPTGAMLAASWATLQPFVIARPDQFRPGPPVALASREWAADYNETREFGARDSAVRTQAQTETAKFWLATGPGAYHQIAREVVAARHMTLVDSARFMAAYATALTDAYIATFDAKYHYEFWRPITAIRNGDIDGNPATEIDPGWQPLEATPMHPEYPCAHCVQSGAAASVIEAFGGLKGVGEVSMVSAKLPGVVHRWSSLDAFTDEVGNARIWAGFHYRSSTSVGTALGRRVGRYVAAHFAPPLEGGSSGKE